MARKFNHSLRDKAKSNKKDEFYTQLIDIERELSNYKKHFYFVIPSEQLFHFF